jgi:hypothetical protein
MAPILLPVINTSTQDLKCAGSVSARAVTRSPGAAVRCASHARLFSSTLLMSCGGLYSTSGQYSVAILISTSVLARGVNAAFYSLSRKAMDVKMQTCVEGGAQA